MSMSSYVLGIDIGTSGVRCLVVDETGNIVARGCAPLPAPIIEGPRHEQDAELWWACTVEALKGTCRDLTVKGGRPENILALSVDATSGTIVPVDKDLKSLRKGLMYNDARAYKQAERLNNAGQDTLLRLGYRFNASFSLAKILWLMENEPDVMEKTYKVLHQSDFITSRLSESSKRYGKCLSDWSNALKSGYDIRDYCWPDYISETGIDTAKLPEVKKSGRSLGTLSGNLAKTFDLNPACLIVAGMTDGTAGCVASGANKIGDMNTTLGTTIVWKMITSGLVSDPEGRLYAHRHPGGGFLPGGAGNSGGEGLSSFFQDDPKNLDEHLARLAVEIRPGPPTGTITYPLASPGERFPFVDSNFAPFTTVSKADKISLYRSCLEGIACIERWGYEVGAKLGAECSGEVWTTGKGADIDPWLQIRADILDRPVCRALHPESAYGAALVAAMNVWFDSSWEDTAAHLIRESFRCEPQSEYRGACNDQYLLFREVCENRRTSS
jgi:sugar (pentulose or hexulose) kinase